MSIKDYDEKGLASVLDGVADLIQRASTALFKIGSFGTPPSVAASLRKEANLCLVEAEELIAQVRAVK
jgi:hypothetical protein